MIHESVGDGQLSLEEFKTLCGEIDKGAREVRCYIMAMWEGGMWGASVGL
jgi:hypothetical protein